MKIEIDKVEIIKAMSEEIKDYLYDAFSQWTDDAEQCIVDNIYKPISDRIIKKFENNKEFQDKIIDNLVSEIDFEKTTIYNKAKEKAINILTKKMIERIEK